MPIRYRIDAPHRLVITEAWDDVTNTDIEAHYGALKVDPGFSPTFDQIADTRRVRRFVADAVMVRQAGAAVFAPGVRRAVVTLPGYLFGMARMFASSAQALGHLANIFDTPADAEAWLGRPAGAARLAAQVTEETPPSGTGGGSHG